MTKNLTKSLLALTLMIVGGSSVAQAGGGYRPQTCNVQQLTTTTASVAVQTPASPIAAGVIYKVVQQTAQYNIRRPEVVSGARVTLFANFLRQEQGCVTFNLNGTSTECNLVDWKPNSVTVELPKLGLLEPKNAEIQIILPDGRVAKTFPVLFISQPDIVMHEDTIPQPMPPAPTTRSAVYAMPVSGGLVLQAGTE